MIPELPEKLRITTIENAVFSHKRSGLGLNSQLGDYSNAAQVVLGYFQNISADSREQLYLPDVATPLIAAGRILDASRPNFFGSRIKQGMMMIPRAQLPQVLSPL